MTGTKTTTAANEVVGFWRDAGPERWFARWRRLRRPNAARACSRHTMPPRVASSSTGWTAPTAPWRWCCCSTRSRATCFAQRPCLCDRPLARHYAARAWTLGFDTRSISRCGLLLPAVRAFRSDWPTRSARWNCSRACPRGEAGLASAKRTAGTSSARFGRFPHRNARTGARKHPEEQAYLAGGGFERVPSERRALTRLACWPKRSRAR